MWKKKKDDEALLLERDKARAVALAYEIELLAQELAKKTATLKKELDGKPKQR